MPINQNSNASTGNNSNLSDVLTRLNSQSSENWVQDEATDFTGSNSLAVYLQGAANGCAVWVFEDESTARIALDGGILQFPNQQIYVGKDSWSNYGIIAISPYSGAECEYEIAEVFGWGK